MADDEAESQREPEDPAPAAGPLEPQSGRVPRRRADTEKAIGLEVARLFGVNPRLLVARRSPPPEGGEEPTESG